jgi:RHS repeat-associated protein
LQTQKTDTTLPKAYLNYLMFDEGFNMLPDLSGAIQVEQANAWQNLDVPQFEIPQNGYLYIFTSNQSQTTVSTDNLYLYHWQSRLLEEFNYYPFGLTFEVTHAQNLQGSDVRYNSQSIERNEFTDNANAKFGLNWYDFMARSYDVQLGRWMQPDPAMQHASPYLAMANNPTSFTDPLGLTAQDHIGIDLATGREVVRAKSTGKDVYTSVIATGRDTWESQGILDNYIPFGKVASSLGFTPGVDGFSRADNLQINYAPNVVNELRILDQQNADRAKFNSMMENENSKIRPDADGILTFGEANGWRRWGKGQPLYVDFSKIDLGNITMADFKKTKTSVQGNPSILVKFDGKNYVNKTQALVYGTITLVKIGSNKVMAMPDNYNFDMKYTPESTYRDIGTLLGLYLTPAGMPFPIYFYNNVRTLR